jgi:hypothetical protein
LSAGTEPSRFSRRILPPRLSSSCASGGLPDSPVPTQSLPSGPEDHAAAVVVAALRDAGEHRRRRAEPAVLVRHPHDAVVVSAVKYA